MKLKVLFFIVASIGVAFFVYLLVLVEKYCVGNVSLVHFVEFSEEAKPEKEYLETRTLHFGDLMLGRGVKRSIDRGVNPFEYIASFIHDGEFDEVVANLEGPFTYSENCQIKPYSFRFDPSDATLLVDAGITGVNLANNHSNDCYAQGIQDTRSVLQKMGIHTFGDDGNNPDEGSRWYSEETGAVFLGFDVTLGLQSLQNMAERIREASETGRRVIVHVHWGNEYELIPHEDERELARLFADNGASLIIGHHPHVVQPAEIIGETPVFYSLGNFIFDQDTLETQTGYALQELIWNDVENGVVIKQQFNLYPYRITGHSPRLLDGDERELLCSRILHDIRAQENDNCSFVIN